MSRQGRYAELWRAQTDEPENETGPRAATPPSRNKNGQVKLLPLDDDRPNPLEQSPVLLQVGLGLKLRRGHASRHVEQSTNREASKKELGQWNHSSSLPKSGTMSSAPSRAPELVRHLGRHLRRGQLGREHISIGFHDMNRRLGRNP